MLVGTIFIEKSEVAPRELTKAGSIKHNVLSNVKFHANEAGIVAQAGYPAAVTIATVMAVVVPILCWAVAGRKSLRWKRRRKNRLRRLRGLAGAAMTRMFWLPAVRISLAPSAMNPPCIDNQLRGYVPVAVAIRVLLLYLSMEDALMRIFARRVSGMMRNRG